MNGKDVSVQAIWVYRPSGGNRPPAADAKGLDGIDLIDGIDCGQD